MTFLDRSANPFYSARIAHAAPRPSRQYPTVYARLPRAPVNASPVPHLTSLYHSSCAGNYGSRRYPGNCGGGLIRDLLLYFRPANVFDPMSGSGTCADVCRELRIPCLANDIHLGFDAADPNGFAGIEKGTSCDFVWAHPPYWRQKLYADDPRDLSRSPTLAGFLDRYATFIRNCANVLSANGKLAILMGDYSDRDEGFVPLTYHTKQLALAVGLKPHCT